MGIGVLSACMCLYVPYGCSAHRSQKRVSDALVVELQMVVTCDMGAGN